jgi:hypothetical protein
VIDLNSKINIIFLSSCMNKSKCVLQGEQWEVPLKNACKYYFFHMPLLFCCMILFNIDEKQSIVFRCITSLLSDKLVWKRYCGAGWILSQLCFIWDHLMFKHVFTI